MKVEVESKCSWVEKIDDLLLENENYWKIVNFYVINTPVVDLSARAIHLREYGWSKPWGNKYYLNKQLKDMSTNSMLMYSAKTYDDMEKNLEKAGLKDQFPRDFSFERVAIYNNKNNQFISTFYHIRNSIAHGRFSVFGEDYSDDWIFAFEDGIKNKKTGKFKVSARMILRLSTLLAWIHLIESGEVEYQRKI